MRKLHSKPQLIFYALAGMGMNLLNLMMNSYLCSALLIGGFGESAIPFQTYVGRDLIIAAVWSVFAFIARIIDGIIDIPMASFTDRLQSRFGRRRPAIVIGLAATIAAYALFLVVPHPAGVSLGNTLWYGILLCLFYCAYTLTMVTYYATYTEIVERERDRAFLSNAKSVCDIVYFIIGYVGVRAMLNGINIRVVALCVLPVCLTMLIAVFMIREPSSRRVEGEDGPEYETVNLVTSLKYTFRNRAFVVWMIVYAAMTFGVQLFLGGINEYFSYTGMSMIFVMMSAFAPVPFTLILYNRILHKHGFGAAYRYTLITFIVGMLWMFGLAFLPAGGLKTVMSIVGGLISSFSIGSIFAVAYSIPAELAAQEQKQTGVSNSAMYFAVQGLFSGVASGIATGIVLTALKKGTAEGTLRGPMFYLTVISAAGAALALVLTVFLPQTVRRIGLDAEK